MKEGVGGGGGGKASLTLKKFKHAERTSQLMKTSSNLQWDAKSFDLFVISGPGRKEQLRCVVVALDSNYISPLYCCYTSLVESCNSGSDVR